MHMKKLWKNDLLKGHVKKLIQEKILEKTETNSLSIKKKGRSALQETRFLPFSY